MIEKLRELLRKSVLKNSAPSLLLSGGLDTSILAYILKSERVQFLPLCVSFEGKGLDVDYTHRLRSFLSIDPVIHNVRLEEVVDAIPKVIKILKSFDPAIPNDLVIYFGLKKLREMGIGSVMTGEGADEIFAGYEYMKGLKNLKEHLKRICQNIHFNSDLLGRSLGVEVKRPYLEREVKSFAKMVPPDMKIRDGFGKWILRKAYEGLLPQSLIYQEKRPLEVGSGMSEIREYLASKIKDEEFEEKKRLYGMNFYSKDHLYYFEIFKSLFGSIPEPKDGEIVCPNCRGGKNGTHCKICGYVEDL